MTTNPDVTKEETLRQIDNLIEKVFREIAENEASLKEMEQDKQNWVMVKVRRSQIFGMKSVIIDIEDMRKTLSKYFEGAST